MRWETALVAAALLAGAASASPPKLGDREVAELVEIAQSEREPETRRARAIRMLEQTDLRTFTGVLRRLLREERSFDIRLSAACTLAALGDRKSPKDLLLVTAYEGSRTPSCSRTDVLVALGRVGDPAAEMHLEKALRSEAPADEPYFYLEACRALETVDTPGARRILIMALRAGAPAVRYASITAVGRLALDRDCPDRQAARDAILEAARGDTEEKVAEQAASALLWVGVDGPAFFRMLESDPDPKCRARAARVMNRHYLTPARLERLRAALAAEADPAVRAAMEETLRGQQPR